MKLSKMMPTVGWLISYKLTNIRLIGPEQLIKSSNPLLQLYIPEAVKSAVSILGQSFFI